MRTPVVRSALATLAVAVVLTACGGGSSTSGSASGTAADVTVVGRNLSWDKQTYDVKAGDVTIALDDKDPVQHNITLVEGNKQLVLANAGKTATVKVNLTPGDHAFFCSVPGHNMKATFHVT